MEPKQPAPVDTIQTDPSRLSNLNRIVNRIVDRSKALAINDEADKAKRQVAAMRDIQEAALTELWRARGTRYKACLFSNYKTTTTNQAQVVEILRHFASDINAEITAGTNVILIGPPGTGKDHLLAVLMERAILSGASVRWISGVKLFARLRDDIDAHARESDTVREFTTPDVLCMSDPTWDAQPLTRQQRMKLGEIVDERYNHRRAVWVSINAKDGAEADETMGKALVDRLRDGAISLACDWPSFREPRKDTHK